MYQPFASPGGRIVRESKEFPYAGARVAAILQWGRTWGVPGPASAILRGQPEPRMGDSLSEFKPKDPADSREVTQPGGGTNGMGATGIFGALQTPRKADATPAFERSETAPASFPPLPPRPAAPPAVVVHEVKFQAQEADDAGAAEPLQRLMQSQSATSGETPLPGGFTQLLSTLQVPSASMSPPMADVAARNGHETPSTTPASPVLSSQLSAVKQASSSGPYPVPDGGEEASFTRLFEALESPPKIPAVSVPVSPVSPMHQPPAQPHVSASPSAPVEAPKAPQGPAPIAAPPASFTQLFAALGNEPRQDSNQSTDYPPIARGASQARDFGRVPSSPPQPAWSAPLPRAAAPTQGPAPDAHGDLNSLTQLLQALESPATSKAAFEPSMPSAAPARPHASSGATVAFTPPESVQRMAAQPPVSASGPGDFTRVLQASALRESGLGSQAAAAARPAEPAGHSAPPASAAGMPLPPWAAPPVPYLSAMPHLAHGGGSGVSLGPGPSLHHNIPGPFSPLHGGPLGHLPVQQPPVPPEAKGGLPVLSLVLIGIIVILVIALVALLLRH